MLGLDEVWPEVVRISDAVGTEFEGVAYGRPGELKAAVLAHRREDGRKEVRFWGLDGEDSFVAEVRDFSDGGAEEGGGEGGVRKVVGMRYVVCEGRLWRAEAVPGAEEPGELESAEGLRHMYEHVLRSTAGYFAELCRLCGLSCGKRVREGDSSKEGTRARTTCTAEEARKAIVRFASLKGYWGFRPCPEEVPLPATFALVGDAFLAKVDQLGTFFGICTQGQAFAWAFPPEARGASKFSWNLDPASQEFGRAVRKAIALSKLVFGVSEDPEEDGAPLEVRAGTLSLPVGCALPYAADDDEKEKVLEQLLESVKLSLEIDLKFGKTIPQELTVFVTNFDVDYFFTFAYIPEIERIMKLLGPRRCYLRPEPYCATTVEEEWSADHFDFVEIEEFPDDDFERMLKERILLGIVTGTAIERKLMLSPKEAAPVPSSGSR
jgi:hypothetical protein